MSKFKTLDELYPDLDEDELTDEELDDAKDVLKILQAMAEKDGVSTLKVSDGRIFFFAKDTLEYLLDKVEETGEDFGVIFIKDKAPTPTGGMN